MSVYEEMGGADFVDNLLKVFHRRVLDDPVTLGFFLTEGIFDGGNRRT